MEPIDRRITAAQLMALRGDPDAERKIAELLGVSKMNPVDAGRTKEAVANFIATGDATVAAQLIHTATVRANPEAGRTGF